MSCKRLRGYQLDIETGKAFQKDPKVLKRGQSQLATKLLTLWSQGKLSASCIQELAHLTTLEDENPEIKQLAKTGNFGQVPGNVARDVTSFFLKGQALCPPHKVRVPCLDRTNAKVEDDCCIFLPHLLFASLARSYPAAFAKLFPSDGLQPFWEDALRKGDDRLVGHPLKKGNWKKNLHPITIHGDGVEYEARDSLMTYSWGASLQGEGSSLEHHLLLACFPKSSTCPETWAKLWEWIIWSFQALQKGLHPTHDPYGNPLKKGDGLHEYAGMPLTEHGWKATIWHVIGDHEFICNVLGMPHWMKASPCYQCNITKEHLKDLDFSKLKFVDSSFAKKEPLSSHPLFDLEGVTSRNLKGDMLHILFVNRIYSHLLGSLCHYICWFNPIGGHQKEMPAKRLSLFFNEIQQEYRLQKVEVRLTNLILSMFCSPKSPHASNAFLHCKGGEAKHLAKPMLEVLKRLLGKSRAIHTQILAALSAITDLVGLWDECGMFLTYKQHQKGMCLVKDFFENYKKLNEWAQKEGRALFHIVLKHHMLYHLVRDSLYCNPKSHSCWQGEDFVGKISQMCRSVSFGTKCQRITVKLAGKYVCMLHLLLTRDGVEWEKVD